MKWLALAKVLNTLELQVLFNNFIFWLSTAPHQDSRDSNEIN